jgi:hypothetical protein
LKEKMRRAAEQSFGKTIPKADRKREEEKRCLVEDKAAEEQVAVAKRDEESRLERGKKKK